HGEILPARDAEAPSGVRGSGGSRMGALLHGRGDGPDACFLPDRCRPEGDFSTAYPLQGRLRARPGMGRDNGKGRLPEDRARAGEARAEIAEHLNWSPSEGEMMSVCVRSRPALSTVMVSPGLTRGGGRPSASLVAAKEHSAGDRLLSEMRDRRKTWIRGTSPSMTRMAALPVLALLFALLLACSATAEEQPSAEAMAKAREVVAASMVPGSQDQMIGGISASIGQLILSVNPGHEEQIGPVVDAYFTPLLRQHFSELSD